MVVDSVRPHRLNTDDRVGSVGTLDDVLRRSRNGLRKLREDFEPQDAAEAAGVSELSQYIANMTKEMLGMYIYFIFYVNFLFGGKEGKM